jgi:membrane-associated phospholipid phosphatase
VIKRTLLALALVHALCPTSYALGQADTVFPPRSLFTGNDAVLAGVFALSAYAARPLDKSFAQRLQRPSAQEHKLLQKAATFFNTTAVPGAFVIGPGMYLTGRLTGNHRAADLGLHGTEALFIGEVLGGVIKGLAGRARPYSNPNDPNPDDWQLMRGFKPGESYRSFPSGHATAAFAAAAAVTAEMSRWSPDTRWIVGTAMYGGAGMVGLSRMYNNRHWASDVIIGAAIGTFAGNKVVRYHHSHPGNKLDEWLVNFSIRGGKLSGSVIPRASRDLHFDEIRDRPPR